MTKHCSDFAADYKSDEEALTAIEAYTDSNQDDRKTISFESVFCPADYESEFEPLAFGVHDICKRTEAKCPCDMSENEKIWIYMTRYFLSATVFFIAFNFYCITIIYYSYIFI